jgi:hypothetical protein
VSEINYCIKLCVFPIKANPYRRILRNSNSGFFKSMFVIFKTYLRILLNNVIIIFNFCFNNFFLSIYCFSLDRFKYEHLKSI